MEQEANRKVRRSEVVIELAGRERRQVLGRLGFHHQLFVDDEVEPLRRKGDPFVGDVDRHLAANAMSPTEQFTFQRQGVDVLQKTVPGVVWTSKNAPITERVSSSSISPPGLRAIPQHRSAGWDPYHPHIAEAIIVAHLAASPSMADPLYPSHPINPSF
jgi:hypothetical protein